MHHATPAARAGCCPHLDDNDPRCSSRFSLNRIEQAFAVCLGAYRGCPMYHELRSEAGTPARRSPPLIHVTVSADGVPVPLRATGT
ncbi:MAG: hypothetical protein ACYTGG_13160 [Planctomycetota bacterium]